MTTNRDFLRDVLRWPEVRRGQVRTDTLEERWRPVAEPPTSEQAWRLAAAALTTIAGGRRRPAADGFRLNGPRRVPVAIGDEVRMVAVDPAGDRPAERAVRPDGSVVLDVGGRAVVARLAAPPTIAAALRHAAPSTGGEIIRAELPGVIGAVRVAAGQAVAAGQVLLVLEAMKMEHPVRAPAGGIVERLAVRGGQAVQRGDELVRLT